jgi:hypothetical protein
VVITVNQNGSFVNNIPNTLNTQLTAFRNNGSVTIADVALGANNSWAIIYNNNKIVSTGIDTSLFNS